MPAVPSTIAPGLSSYLRLLKSKPATELTDHLILLLQRRQIQASRPCASATAHLLIRVVEDYIFENVGELLNHVRNVGRRLAAAQPRELTIGNVVRRVLGLIAEVAENPTDRETNNVPNSNSAARSSGSTSLLVDVLANGISAPGTHQNHISNGIYHHNPMSMKDVKDDVLNGMQELLDELDQADEQIASYGEDHVHANEIILTYTSSITVQKFLLQVAKRRKFTVIHVEGYPNEHRASYDTILKGRKRASAEDPVNESRLKPLTAVGINVIIIPDSAVFAIMAKVNKVILPSHAVLSNGGFVAAAGSKIIAQAAKWHKTPLVVLGAIYELSPLYPYNVQALIEYGDASKVISYEDGDLVDGVDVINPMQDYIQPDLVDLFITNIGGHAPSYIYRVVADHYRSEDTDL